MIQDQTIPYIGFLLDTLEEERWYKDKQSFEDHVKSLGGQVKTLAANGSDARFIVNKLISRVGTFHI